MTRSTARVEICWDEFASEALAGNALGDPATRPLPVLLPPGYADDSARRYPVLYGLAGFTGRGASMLNVEAWQPTLAERLERLYAGGMPPVIVVLPDCFTRLGGSQYLNSPATGRYEDYVTREIVPYIDEHYRTVATAAGRGVFGKSSGGYGALIMGMRHADLFSAIACHSGDSYFDLCYRPDFPGAALAITRAGGLEAWFQAFESREKKTAADHAALNIVAMAACYSPAPGAALGLDLPFDLYTCALREDVWARWQAWDPVRMAPRYTDALASLRLLFIDCGVRDEFNLQFGARLLTSVLREHDIAYDYEEFDDDHRSISYRYDVSLPRLAAALHGGG